MCGHRTLPPRPRSAAARLDDGGTGWRAERIGRRNERQGGQRLVSRRSGADDARNFGVDRDEGLDDEGTEFNADLVGRAIAAPAEPGALLNRDAVAQRLGDAGE